MEAKGIYKYWPYAVLLLFVTFTYAPIVFQVVALKNDALTDNFPQKFFFSKALFSNSIPIWNPFINHGIPLYADPGFTYWHPITWCMGLLGYSVGLLSVESIIYILAGGWSMYQLGKAFGYEKITCTAMAILYSGSGFMVANLQYTNFLTGASILPLCFSTCLIWFRTQKKQYAILFGLTLYLLLAGGHPALPIAFIYFFIFSFLYTVCISFRFRLPLIRRFVIRQAPLFFYALLFCLPILYSHLEIVPYLNRNASENHSLINTTGFSPGSYTSFLFPFAAHANTEFITDNLLFRNAYLTIPGFLLLLWAILKKNKSAFHIFILAAMVFYLILSTGGTVKTFLYSKLPLLSYIRNNGAFRIFFIIGALVLIGSRLNEVFKFSDYARLQKTFTFLLSVSLLLFLLNLFSLDLENITRYLKADSVSISSQLKYFLDESSFSEKLSVDLLLNVLLGIAALLLIRKKITISYIIILLISMDAFIHNALIQPITGYQMKSPAYFDKIIQGFPQTITVPKNNLIGDFKNWEHLYLGDLNYYQNELAYYESNDYPTKFRSTDSLYQKSITGFRNHQYLFGNAAPITFQPDFFNGREFIAAIQSDTLQNICFFQNYYTGWNVEINNNRSAIGAGNMGLISFQVPEGKSIVKIYYQNNKLRLVVIVWIIAGIIFLITMIKFPTRGYSRTKPASPDR